MAITVTDTFQRVAANLGANWTNVLNGFTANNAAIGTNNTTTAFNVAYWSAIPFTSDQSSTIVVGSLVAGANSNVGAAVRIQPGTGGAGTFSYYVGLALPSPSFGLYIYKVVNATATAAGTLTLLAQNASIHAAPGDILSVSVIGSTITLTYNNSNSFFVQAVDTTLLGGSPGIHQGQTSSSIASFVGVSETIPSGSVGNLVCDGDSIVSGYGLATPWTASLTLNNGPWSIANLGVPSRTLATCITNAATSVDPLFTQGLKNVVFIWAGINDMAAGVAPAAIYANLKTYCVARHAKGWKVLVSPLLANSTNGNTGANVQVFNALLAASFDFADGIVSEPSTLTAFGANTNPTYFQNDNTHPNQTTATTIIAPAVSAAVNSLPIGGSSGSGLNVVGSGAGFATQIKSPRTAIIGTNLGTRII